MLKPIIIRILRRFFFFFGCRINYNLFTNSFRSKHVHYAVILCERTATAHHLAIRTHNRKRSLSKRNRHLALDLCFRLSLHIVSMSLLVVAHSLPPIRDSSNIPPLSIYTICGVSCSLSLIEAEIMCKLLSNTLHTHSPRYSRAVPIRTASAAYKIAAFIRPKHAYSLCKGNGKQTTIRDDPLLRYTLTDLYR